MEKFDFLISGGRSGWQIANPFFFLERASCTVRHLLDIPACTFLSAVLSVSALGITNYLWSPHRVNPSFGHTRGGFVAETQGYTGVGSPWYLVLSGIAWRGPSCKYVKCVARVYCFAEQKWYSLFTVRRDGRRFRETRATVLREYFTLIRPWMFMRNLRVPFREHKEVSSSLYKDKLDHVVYA